MSLQFTVPLTTLKPILNKHYPEVGKVELLHFHVQANLGLSFVSAAITTCYDTNLVCLTGQPCSLLPCFKKEIQDRI